MRSSYKKSIARSDAARGSYYKSISGHEWGDAHQYELSVDSPIGEEKTAKLICDYISRIIERTVSSHPAAVP